MQKWQKLNVYFSLGGLLLFIVSLLLMKKMPLFLLSAMFGIGVTFKSFMNIYKGVEPPSTKKIEKAYNTGGNKRKKKRK